MQGEKFAEAFFKKFKRKNVLAPRAKPTLSSEREIRRNFLSNRRGLRRGVTGRGKTRQGGKRSSSLPLCPAKFRHCTHKLRAVARSLIGEIARVVLSGQAQPNPRHSRRRHRTRQG
jgi:hypothetical protein